jgi:predicted nucleic acid-binding protein
MRNGSDGYGVVLVDSSIWIEFFRGRNTAVVNRLCRLLEQDQVLLAAPVRLEILAGASRTETARLRRVLSALPLVTPAETIWSKLEVWIERARKARERFGVMDLLIAGIADDAGASLWSSDRDFARMSRLGLVKLDRG